MSFFLMDTAHMRLIYSIRADESHNVHVVCVFLHSTHILHPADRALFRCLKMTVTLYYQGKWWTETTENSFGKARKKISIFKECTGWI